VSAIFLKVQEIARRAPDKLAIKGSDGINLTYSQLVELVWIKIKAIQHITAATKARVALCMHEGIELPSTVLALNALGHTVIPINPSLQAEQVAHFLRSVDADILIVDEEIKQSFRNENLMIRVYETNHLNQSFEVASQTKTELLHHSDYDQFLITLSSGSTGMPKPIVFSEANKIARFEQTVRLFSVTKNDVVLCASPFYHSLGQRLTFLPLLLGATLVQLTRFTAFNWSKTVVENGVTFTIPVSSHLHELVDLLLAKPFVYNSLRCIVTSSAAINETVKQDLFESLSCDFYEMYGASEIATATTLNREQARYKLGSVGIPCPGVEVRVVDSDLNDCEPGETGQIIVRSPLASSGYYGLPSTTSESFIGGFFLTGDLGYLDQDGYLFFVDRKKDLIVAGGINIYPSDIETVINEIPSVKDCAVVGINDPYLVEVPVAAIILRDDSKLTEKEIRSYVGQKLSSFQRPLKYFFRSDFPMTASGKLDKKALREEFNALNLDLTAKLRAIQSSR